MEVETSVGIDAREEASVLSSVAQFPQAPGTIRCNTFIGFRELASCKEITDLVGLQVRAWGRCTNIQEPSA